jgi:hypothetical protein
MTCPLDVIVTTQMQYVKNCYYEVGVNRATGLIDYAAVTDGSNTSITSSSSSTHGLLAEELDIGYGGAFSFTSASVSFNSPISSIPLSYVEEGISGDIVSTTNGATILQGTINMTFFANEPYFVASLSSNIEVLGMHSSHDFANWVNPTWNNEWVGPGNNGTTEVCTSIGCTHYTEAENTFDTVPVIRSLFQRNGPTWGWLGSSTYNEGVGFLLLGFNSTSPNEAAITHYEIRQTDFEIEGTGVAPASTGTAVAPHAPEYSSSVPQKMYAAFLIYLNAGPYTAFLSFINGYWKNTLIGSYLGSSSSYAAFAEIGRTPNAGDYNWYITNLVTSVSAPQISHKDAMIYFTGRNSSLANNFPMKMYLNVDGSISDDWNFGTPTATVLSNDGTNAKLQVVWNDPTNGLQLSMTFSTKSDSNKINVTGYVEATNSNGYVSSLALQANVFENFLDGTGPPSQSPSSINHLSWNYTNGASSVGVSVLNNGGFTSAEFTNSMEADLYLASLTPSSPKAPFSFAVSFYDPLSDFSTSYTEPIYVPTLNIFTQPFGNASQVGFTEDNSRVFSYLQSVTQFNSNETIAAMQFIKPFSGDLEVYYAGSVSSLRISFSNGTSEPASTFYNSQTNAFNFNVVSITSASLTGLPTPLTSVSCSPGSVAIGSLTTCTAIVTGNNPTGSVSWQSSESGTFSSNSCDLSSGSCSVSYTPDSSIAPVTITAYYLGDANNAASSGTYLLNVPELQVPGITISCSPSSILAGTSTTCVATVFGSSPTGTVTFSSSDTGATFSPSSSCTLSSDSCQVTYTPSVVGSAKITASYSGDANNPPSSNSTSLKVQALTTKGQSFPISLALIIGSLVVAVVIIGASLFVRRRS